MNLSGLSATYPGYMAQENQTATTNSNQAAAQEAAFKLLGAQVLGRALAGGQGPQPPAPGQPSVPNQPPQAPPVAQGGPQGGAPVPQPPPQPAAPTPAPAAGASPSGMPEISLQALTARILQTTPQVAQHPQILLAALERAKPLLDQQGQADLADLRERQLTEQQRYHDILDKQRVAAESGRQSRFDINQARLTANAAVRNDAMTQRLEMQQQDLQRKIAAGDRGAALSQWRAVTDALHKRASEIIQSNSVGSNMDDASRKTLLDEQRAAYEAQIANMRGIAGSSTPQGGTTPPGQPIAPKVQGQVPQGQPGLTAVSQPPPVAMLKPGGINIINGVGWRIGPDGQPVQVPIPGQ